MAKDPVDKGLKGIASGWFERSLKTANLGRALATEMATHRIKRAFADEAESDALDRAAKERVATLIAEQAGKLKGLAMKIGQILSYMDSGLPESARKILATLQDSTPAMHPQVVRGLIKSELGKYPEELFKSWNETPIAAASIGQVHRAVTHAGEILAIKVQYPEIKEAFTSDFRNLALLGRALDMILPGKASGIIDELKERLAEECDYLREMQNLDHFRSLFAGREGVRFPKTYPDYTSRRVLATEFVAGRRFAEFIASASQQEKNRAGATIYTLVYDAIWRHRCFNGDPHPGNYLFTDQDVVFLDYGCVRHWQPAFIDGQRRLVHAALSGDLQRFKASAISEGLAPRPDGLDFVKVRGTSLALMRPYLVPGEFTFTGDFVAAMTQYISRNADFLRTSMPPELTLVNRVWWGLYSVLAAMNATFEPYGIVMPLIYPQGGPYPVVPPELLHGLEFKGNLADPSI